jgi:hypothetical protein
VGELACGGRQVFGRQKAFVGFALDLKNNADQAISRVCFGPPKMASQNKT